MDLVGVTAVDVLRKRELPGPARRLFLADRACCCPARPVVTVVIPAGRGRPYQANLLLCGHHYLVSLAALHAAGAYPQPAGG